MNGKVLMLAIIFFGGFHVFYAFNRVQNFANIMYRLCAIQLGECLIHISTFYEKFLNSFPICILNFFLLFWVVIGLILPNMELRIPLKRPQNARKTL